MANLTGAATTHDSSVGNGATNYSPETPPPNRGLSSTGTPLSLQHDRQDNRIKNENPLRYEHQTSTPCTSPTNCQLPEFSIVSTISTTYIKRARVDRRRFVLEQDRTAKNKKPLRGPQQLIAVHARTDRVSTARRACSFQNKKETSQTSSPKFRGSVVFLQKRVLEEKNHSSDDNKKQQQQQYCVTLSCAIVRAECESPGV